MIGRRYAWAVLALGVLGSQAGHLLAYQLRFGATAQQLQSSGAHSYFSTLVKSSLGIAALGLVAALLMIGLARMLAGRRPVTATRGPSYVGLLAALFTIQLTCFVGQEIVEAQIAGSQSGSVAHLLLWGTLGQLPVAAVGALALRWLAVRLEAAVNDLRGLVAAEGLVPRPIPVLIPVWAAPNRAQLMSRVAGSSLAKRGPPASSRIRPY